MRFFPAVLLPLLAACSPSLNWREVPVEATGLKATFPCKPDKVEHKSQFSPGRDIVLHAMACEAGGASYVLLRGDVGSQAEVAAALVQFKRASASTIHATVVSEKPWQPPGALGLADSSMMVTSAPRDGGELQAQSAYFARGTNVYQAAVYAPRLKPEMTEPFFTGLRFE
jgi:hypothetical protein